MTIKCDNQRLPYEILLNQVEFSVQTPKNPTQRQTHSLRSIEVWPPGGSGGDTLAYLDYEGEKLYWVNWLQEIQLYGERNLTCESKFEFLHTQNWKMTSSEDHCSKMRANMEGLITRRGIEQFSSLVASHFEKQISKKTVATWWEQENSRVIVTPRWRVDDPVICRSVINGPG